MGRIVVTLTDEMHEKLKELVQDSGYSISSATRLALHDWLKAKGIIVENWNVEWGGDRKADE